MLYIHFNRSKKTAYRKNHNSWPVLCKKQRVEFPIKLLIFLLWFKRHGQAEQILHGTQLTAVYRKLTTFCLDNSCKEANKFFESSDLLNFLWISVDWYKNHRRPPIICSLKLSLKTGILSWKIDFCAFTFVNECSLLLSGELHSNSWLVVGFVSS